MSSPSKTRSNLRAALWSRREILAAGALGAAALQLPAWLAAANGRNASLEGPLPDTLTRGLMVWDVGGIDYIAEEYFLSGNANVYQPVSMADAADVASRDNVKDLGARTFSREVLRVARPFTTRLIVYRPRSKQRFSGKVIAESLHPTGGGSSLMWNTLHGFFSAHGDIYVGVQHPLTIAGLKAADSLRYGALHFEDATQLWGMLTQTGAAIKNGGVGSPLRGYRVRHLLLTGYSYTGVATATFANYHHQEAKLRDGRNIFDAYLPMADAQYVRPLDVPVMRLNTQSDYNGFGGLENRRPDDARYRHYEIAGASHVAVPPPADAAKPPAAVKLPPAPGQPHFSAADCQQGFPPGSIPNDYPLYLVQAAMFSNMYEWLDLKRAPPSSVFIETDADGATLLDDKGNAQGGVRLPQVSVPIAKYGVGSSAACILFGYTQPFPAAVSQALYGGRAAYVARVQADIERLIADRWILPNGRERLLDSAQARANFEERS
ncbi:MAG TPA: alpha/beta hydrolase domain-containing protein [Steroidobacteraceae bacterium]|nr:alpha/beta hydrolase domain-containing protein [Steroidobacteraceae bacterium]